MNLNKTILVNQGQAMITEAINTSQPIILTKFTIGKGTVATENAALALTNVVLSHRDVAIANNTQEGNVYKCTCYYDNKTEPADVTIKEIGLYGKVGASGTVKLFAYVTFEPGDYLPIGGGSVYSEYSKVLNVGITELATVQSVVNIIVENATKTSLGVVQIGNGVAVNTNGVISLGTTNDGLIINASDIKLDTQNTLTSTSITKPLSANMGKQLQDTKANETTQIIAGSGLTGGGDLSANRTINVVSANAGITVNADNIELKPATTSVIGGVKPDGTTTSVDVNGVISTVNRASISTQIIAGNGLTGGGDLTASRTLAVASATDGIVVNADNIQLSTINNLTTVSATKPLSAGQGKILQDSKFNKRTSAGVADLDTMKTDGLFYGYQWTNAPINNNSIATVDVKVYSPDWIVQSVFDITYQRYFVRYWHSGTTWSSWVTVLSEKDVINNLISTSATLPLSAGQGKQLQDTKADKTTQIVAGNGLTGGGDLTTDRTLNIVSANAGIVVNADNIELKPATTSIIGGVKPDGTTITVDGVGKITTSEKWKSKNNYSPIALDADSIFENGEFQLTLASQTTPPSILIGSQFFLTCRMTNETDSGYGIQCAYSYSSTQNADVIAYRTYSGGTKSWGSWRYLVDKVVAEETYVKKAGDTMTGELTAAALTTTNGTNETGIYARYNNLTTDIVYLYNNSTDIGIYNNMPTHGNVPIFLRSKSTGVVYYAGGNYGTINGSTATFSGNVTAPSITIGGYVVTIV